MLDDFLRRLCTTGSIERKAGSGRPRSCFFVCFKIFSGSVETQLW